MAMMEDAGLLEVWKGVIHGLDGLGTSSRGQEFSEDMVMVMVMVYAATGSWTGTWMVQFTVDNGHYRRYSRYPRIAKVALTLL